MASSENLMERLKAKLVSGEINQEEYDQLFAKFQKLGILGKDQPDSPDSRNIYASGTKTVNGGKYGSVVSSGKLIIDGPLECRRLSIAGAAEIDGNLSVIDTTIISGELIVHGLTKFGGSVSSTGTIDAGGDVYTAAKFNSSGNLSVDGNIITDQRLIIEAGLSCYKILSSSKVTLLGKIEVKDIIVAETLELAGGNIEIGGDIKARKVIVMEPIFNINSEFLDDISELDQYPVIKNITKSLTNTFLPKIEKFVTTLSNVIDPSSIGYVEIKGNVIAGEIYLSNSLILGDVIGDKITLGQNIRVTGTVKYRKEINVKEYEGIVIEKLKDKV